jgi:hypothetical protein
MCLPFYDIYYIVVTAAWIQWYIGEQNVTNQATPQPPQQDGDKFISSSILVYTGRDVDHNKIVFCEAVNIEGRQKVTFCSPIYHCIQAAGRLESVVQVNVCVSPSTISTALLSPSGMIVTVVTGTGAFIDR